MLYAFMRKVFDKVDVLLAPAMPISTPTRSETATDHAQNIEEIIHQLLRFTRPISFLGLPTLVLPMGFDSKGMPLGQQLIGRPFAESNLLRLGHAYQQQTLWHTRRPEYAESFE
jgi:aspartyl-tRNA(Asn)/glutamyl-tRNA(Gln) amidotransferase subunit A